jgi:hypothetical protein
VLWLLSLIVRKWLLWRGVLYTLIYWEIDIKFSFLSFEFSFDPWRSMRRMLEFWSPGHGHKDQVRLLQRPDRGRPKFVGSGPHHVAPYIRHSWRVNQGSSVNNILSEGPDLLGAEVVGCPMISPSPSTSTPGSTPLPAPHLVQVCLQASSCVSIPLSQIELRLKTIHRIPKTTPYWFKP